MAVDFLSNEEIVQAARRNIPQGAWDYLVGGSESETTLRRNRLAFDRIAFRPRILRDVTKIDTSTDFMGNKLRIPVLLAPIGSLQAFTPDRRCRGGAGGGELRHDARGQLRRRSPALEETAEASRRRRSSSSTSAATTTGWQTSSRALPRPGYMGACGHGRPGGRQPSRAADDQRATRA